MKPAETKANRILQIEALLLEHPEGLSQAELARRLNVNRSTICRNLSDVQAPLYEENGKLYIDRKGYLVNVRLNIYEALSIHLASRLLTTTLDRKNPHAASALRKLSIAMERLAPKISQHISASADAIDEDTQWQDPNYLRVLETLTQAWAETRKVMIWHRRDGDSPVNQYTFSTYYIEPSAVGRSTYVFGMREPPNEMRTFKIERIQRIELLAEKYVIPDDFDSKELLSDAWGIWYTEKEPIEVILKFSPRVAHRVGETRWHRSEQVITQEDGSLLWRAWISEPLEMMPWIRGWGADVEVIEPESLRDNIAEEAFKLYKIYRIIMNGEKENEK